MSLLPGGYRPFEVRLNEVGSAEVSWRVRKRAHSGQRNPADRGLLTRERQRLSGCGGPVDTGHDVAGNISAGWPPVPADHDDRAGCVPGHLMADRTEQEPGQPAEAARAHDYHAAGGAVLAQRPGRRAFVSNCSTSCELTARRPRARICCALACARSSRLPAPPAAVSAAYPGVQAWHTVSMTLRSLAVRAAQFRACWLLDDPSYPTRIPRGLSVMATSVGLHRPHDCGHERGTWRCRCRSRRHQGAGWLHQASSGGRREARQLTRSA